MLQNGTTKVNKRTKKNVYGNTRGLVEQGVLGIVIGVVIGSDYSCPTVVIFSAVARILVRRGFEN